MSLKVCEKVGYVRVSKDDQNPESQRLELLSKGVPEDCIFTDWGQSGIKPAMKRQGFKDLMAYLDSHKGAVKYLYVFEISRIGRSMFETFTLINNLERDYKVKVWSLTENEAFTRQEDDSIRNFLLAVYSWVAEVERKKIVERTKSGIRRAKDEGKQIGRKRKPIDDRRVMELHDAGMTWRQIAAEMKVTPMTMYRYRKRKGLEIEGE